MKPFAILPAFLLLADAPRVSSAGDLIPEETLADMQAADVVIPGEIHNNPHHHLVQT